MWELQVSRQSGVIARQPDTKTDRFYITLILLNPENAPTLVLSRSSDQTYDSAVAKASKPV